MRLPICVIFYFALCIQTAFGQFSSNTSVTVGNNYAYQNNGIAVTGLGNLDGINLGVTSIELTINITTLGGNVPQLDLYLVAPDGHAVFILSNDISSSGTYIFNSVVPQGTIKYNARTPGTYRTFGNLNSLNLNQSANGNWRLYAKQSRAPFINATIASWRIIFGNTNLSPGAPNQSFTTALPLINTTATGNFIVNTNNLHGVVLAESKGSEVGDNKPLTETTVWYSFTPKCKNDRIQIKDSIGYLNSAILNSSRTVVSTTPAFFNTTYTYQGNYTPGNTYYLAMDADQADLFQYWVKWYEGDVGCTTPPTITTSDQTITEYCPGSPVNIAFTHTGTFNSGNRFTAQLSDTLGSFTNPQILGFKDAATPSVINGTLPAGLKPGKSYKIRVVASAPAITGSVNTGITILALPAAPSAITGKSPVCAGEKNVAYFAEAVPNVIKYRWKLTAGAQIVATTADSSSIKINFGSMNSDISVSAINECGSGPAYQKTIIVTPLLTPAISINNVPATICQGDSVKLQSSYSNQGPNPIFSWKVNNQNYGTKPSVTIKNLKNKDSVSVVLTSDQACITTPTALSGQLIFTVRDTVKPSINLSGNTTLCSGSFTTLTAKTQNKGTNPFFNWYVNNILQVNQPDSTFRTNQFKNNDSVWVRLTSNATCVRPSEITSSKLKITISNTIIPAVTILGNKQVCKGSPLTLNATGQNEGGNPLYNWYVNNVLQNTGSTFSSSKLQDKDSIYVTLTSDDPCAQPAKVSSPQLKISVADTIKPSVIITGNTPVCQGTSIILNAKTTNKGPNPVFNWYVNNVLQNTSVPDSVFTSAILKNNDSVWVSLTSNAACVRPATVTSLKAKIVINDTIKPSVNILGETGFCKGSTVVYNTSAQYTGQNPTFTWFINNVAQNNPGNTATFSSDKLKNKDSIWVTMQSDAVCAKPGKVTSPKLFLLALDTVKPSVTIKGPDFSCKGQYITLEAQVMNGGNAQSFTWIVNGTEQNTNNVYFSGANFKNGDSFAVKLQSSLQCALPKTAFSDAFIISVYDTVKPSITLTTDTVFCIGQPVTIFTKVENQGNNPFYSWFQNDISVADTKDFSSVLPVGSHTLNGVVNSNEKCAFPSSAGKTITVIVKDTVKIKPLITGDTVLCQGSQAFFRLTNAGNSKNTSYNWMVNGALTGKTDSVFNISGLTNGATISLKAAGNEKCTVFSGSNTLSAEVTAAVTPQVSITVFPTEACPGESTTYRTQVTNPGVNEIYSWTENNLPIGNNEDSLITIFSPQATVILNYNTALTCGTFNASFSAPAVQLKESPPLLFSISGPDTYCADDEALTFSTTRIENAVYEWTYPSYIKSSEKGNNITLSFEGNTKTDTLKVKARNTCGYGNEVSLLLHPKNCTTLYIPNAILSSDGNGNNLWKIKGIENYPDVLVMVFNRWGMKVFSSLGYPEAWDGTSRGKELPTGTYYYVIEGIENKPITGALTIVH